MASRCVLSSQCPVRCARHSLACGPDGRCVVCVRESAAPGPSWAALPVLAAAVALLVAGTLAYRLGNASQSVTLAIAQAAFPAPVQVHAVALREAVTHPEQPPSAAPDPTREHGMRELQEALENAWRAGLAEAATATADSPGVSADPPTGESAIAAATATTATAIATPTPTATPTATATTTETPSPTPTADPGAATAALSPTRATTTHVADEGPHDDHLVVYTAPGCSACSLAKEWMTAYGIP